jgi:hypothetical protein
MLGPWLFVDAHHHSFASWPGVLDIALPRVDVELHLGHLRHLAQPQLTERQEAAFTEEAVRGALSTIRRVNLAPANPGRVGVPPALVRAQGLAV